MKIEKIAIKEIKPNENNAKLHPQWQLDQIKESIVQFGNNDPIAIDENNVVIEGYGRSMALEQLGYEEAEIIRLEHLTEEQKSAYILAHNKLTMNTDFDLEILEEELGKIKSIDMQDFGFELSFDVKEIEAEEDEYLGTSPAEPRTKYGDIFQLGRHRLMCGDATNIDDVNLLLNDCKIDVVLTDPPYGINVVTDSGKVGAKFKVTVAKKGDYEKIIADETTDTAQEACDILLTICDRCIIWGGNYFTEFLPFSDSYLVWDKRVDSGIRNTFADGELAWCSFKTPVRIYHQLWNGMIREGEHEKRLHPTQKPVKMLGEILKDFSEESDNILDVFGGSGSTLIACEQLERNCYMMEMSPKYCDVIIDRWEKNTGETARRI